MARTFQAPARLGTRPAGVFSRRRRKADGVNGDARTDEALYLAFRDRGEESALDALLRRHWPLCYRLALGLVRDPGAAEDVAQEAFVQVAAAARERKTLDPFGGWLATVVLNVARKRLRGARRRERHEDEARARRPEEATVDGGSIDEYVALLPDDLAAPLALHYGLGLTHAETAAALGCPTGTVASRLRSGVEKLRERLGATTAVGTTSAVEALLAEGWVPVREARVPAAPRAAQILARTPGSLAPRGLRALPATATATLLASLACLAVGGIAFSKLARTSPDPSASDGTALAPPTSQGAPVKLASPAAPGGPDSAAPGQTPRAARSPLALAPTSGPSAAEDGSLAALSPEDVGEPTGPAPGYPWHEWSAEERARIAESERLLDERRLSCDFDQVPLASVLAGWTDVAPLVGLPPVFLDEHLDPGVARESRITLKVREISARNALSLVLAAHDDLVWEVEAGGVRVLSNAEASPASRAEAGLRALQIPRLPRKRPGAAQEVTPEQIEARRAADEKLRGWAQLRVELDFQETPLVEVVNQIQDATGLNVTVSKSVDLEEVKLTGSLRGKTLGEAFVPLLTAAGLGTRVHNETVFICPVNELPKERRDDQGLWTTDATLDLRGVPLRDLVNALSRFGITAVVSPEAWRSNGTVSLVAGRGTTVKQLLDRVGKELGLTLDARAVDDDQGTTREIHAVLGGEVPSARQALEAPLPPFAGVARDVRALRAKLARALSLRRAERQASPLQPTRLLGAEANVHALSADTLDLIRRANAVVDARERRAALPSLADADARVAEARQRVKALGAGATARDLCLVFGLEAKRDELRWDTERADEAVALLEKLEAGEPLPPARK